MCECECLVCVRVNISIVLLIGWTLKNKSGILKNIYVRRALRKFYVYVHIGYTARSYSQLIDGKTRLIETSLVCNSFVATSNNSKSSLSSNYIYLSGDIWNSLLACLAFRLLVDIKDWMYWSCCYVNLNLRTNV